MPYTPQKKVTSGPPASHRCRGSRQVRPLGTCPPGAKAFGSQIYCFPMGWSGLIYILYNMCIYIYLYMYIYMYIYLYMYIYMYVYVYVYYVCFWVSLLRLKDITFSPFRGPIQAGATGVTSLRCWPVAYWNSCCEKKWASNSWAPKPSWLLQYIIIFQWDSHQNAFLGEVIPTSPSVPFTTFSATSSSVSPYKLRRSECPVSRRRLRFFVGTT